MEKRTILALVLMIIILFVWQSYYTPKPQTRPQGTGQTGVGTPTETQKPAPTKENEPLGKESPTRVADREPGKNVVVSTPLMTITLSDFGGGINSVKLKKFKQTIKGTQDKEMVEDISPHTYLPRLARAVDGNILDDGTRFQPDKEGLTVQDKAETITFTGSMTDGKRVKKIYTFHPGTYTIDVRIVLQGVDGEPARADFAVISGKNANTYVFKGPFYYDGKKFHQIEKVEKLTSPVQVGRAYTYSGLDDGFFTFIWIPGPESHYPLAITKTASNVPVLQVALEKGELSGTLFFGPKKTQVLQTLNVGAEKIIDFGWFDIIAKPLVLGLNLSNKVTHNYGVDIILLTILIKIIFYPLSVKSYKSMKEMQKLQPLIAKLREKYKDDRQKLNQEMMGLYKQRGVNPMGGCLPMVIQIPVFFALYKALSSAIELRHAPFMLWMNDLSAPEDLFTFTVAGFALPIRILPLIMGITQVIQQKMTPTSADPMQEKIMLFMPIFFTFLFWGFPAGLVLYWLINNVISIGQQYYINKKVT
jgi:YidC/Oxa1 family membrane protein insertase